MQSSQQNSQFIQTFHIGLTPPLSPNFQFFTLVPTLTTTPAPSWPGERTLIYDILGMVLGLNIRCTQYCVYRAYIGLTPLELLESSRQTPTKCCNTWAGHRACNVVGVTGSCRIEAEEDIIWARLRDWHFDCFDYFD